MHVSEPETTIPASKPLRLYRYLSRVFIFVVVLLVLFFGLNSFLQPIWYYENNYHTYRSFYEEPKNTIETVFVGASMTLFGFSPMEMYEQNGICAYNLASTSQPFMMSYYWVLEAERFHAETLDTVVLDVSMLRRTPKDEDYRKALDGMQWSPVKEQAISDLSDSPLDKLTYHFPILDYHDRWSQINYTDFLKYEDDIEDYVRGYYMEFHRIFDEFRIEEIGVPLRTVDPATPPAPLETQSLFYLNKLIDFCKEKGIKLVLCKTPSPSNWGSSEHNAIQAIADSYDIEFLDFEADPLLSELGYCAPLDSKDLNKHLNYYGAMKLSRYMSTYLSEVCGNRDVRGDARYVHLEDQLAHYHDKVTKMADATLTDDVGSYVSNVVSADNYTMLVSVRGDGSNMLTAAQRIAFGKAGLHGLATLKYGDSYLAVVSDGKVEYEQIDRSPSTFDSEVEHYIDELRETPVIPEDGDVVEDEEDNEEGAVDLGGIDEGEWDEGEESRVAITHAGQFADGTKYTLMSGGNTAGNVSSCLIEVEGVDQECSLNGRGINITVYDNDSHRMVHQTCFDTSAASLRETPALETLITKPRYVGQEYASLSPNVKRLYRYKRKTDYAFEAKTLKLEIGPGGLYKYLQNFCRDGLIVLVAVKDEASGSLTPEARQALIDMGFTDVGVLGHQSSYCAAVEDGVVTEQQVSQSGDEPTTIVHKWYTISSAGYRAGNYASIIIDDNGYSADYALNSRGFNIVVYNPRLDIVVDRAAFDTAAVPIDLP